MVKTKPHDYLTVNQMPTGINSIVLMACFTGYNQEDSIIVNQSAIQRGMFRSAYYRTYKTEENVSSHQMSKSIIAKPDPEACHVPPELISRIDEDGIIPPGTPI